MKQINSFMIGSDTNIANDFAGTRLNVRQLNIILLLSQINKELLFLSTLAICGGVKILIHCSFSHGRDQRARMRYTMFITAVKNSQWLVWTQVKSQYISTNQHQCEEDRLIKASEDAHLYQSSLSGQNLKKKICQSHSDFSYGKWLHYITSSPSNLTN